MPYHPGMVPVVDSEGWITSVHSSAPRAMKLSLSEQSMDSEDAVSTTTAASDSFSSGDSSASAANSATTTSSSLSSPSLSSATSNTSSNDDNDNTTKRPVHRTRTRASPPPALTLGSDPKALVGRVLKYIRRSDVHPAVTLAFADGSAVQVLVDGYNPRSARTLRVGSAQGAPGFGYRIGASSAQEDVFGGVVAAAYRSDGGSPKLDLDSDADLEWLLQPPEEKVQLEMDDALARLLASPGSIAPVGAAIRDCAFVRLTDRAHARGGTQRWDAHHLAFAVKFECDAEANASAKPRWHCIWATRAARDADGRCVARTFDDVYVQPLARTPSQASPTKHASVSSPTKPSFAPSPTKSSFASSPTKPSPRGSPTKATRGGRHQRRESWRG